MRLLGALSGVIISLLIANYSVAMTGEERQTANLCRSAIQLIETKVDVPNGLLDAIALKETGRWDASQRESVAWPWTITAEGKGLYFATKKQALEAIQELKKRNINNIDIGCMQVNLWYHPHAFDSLENALDPKINTTYAAEFLRQLNEDYRSWNTAVERYHSNDPERGRRYRKAVYQLKSNATSKLINGSHTRQSTFWKKRQDALRKEILAARKFRLESSRRLQQANAQQKALLREAFENRKAKVLQKWEKMLQKRRQKLRSNARPT